jgi:hypothetical protein
MFRPCWAIFRENSFDTLWLHLYSVSVNVPPGGAHSHIIYITYIIYIFGALVGVYDSCVISHEYFLMYVFMGGSLVCG